MEPRVDGLSDLIEVGRGGFGTVYRANDERFGRRVAVKVIRDAGLGRHVVARFERECLALGSLSGHPNIVSVYDSGTTDDGDLYLVMEYLAGGSLAQRLTARGPADAIEVATWGAALAGALETAHRSGIVHRDVKPENALFSEYGTLKLVDFGIARMRSAYETRSGFISATLNHAAPEVVAGTPISPSADVYSLASVLFTMMYGQAPFEQGGEDSLAPLIARIVNSNPPNLRQHGVPDEIAAVVERELLKPVEERYGSAAEFGHALQTAAQACGGGHIIVPVGDAEEVAEAAAVIQSGPDTPREGERPATTGTVAPGEHTDVVARYRPTVEPLLPAAESPRQHRKALIATAATVVLILAATAFVFWPGRGDHPTVATKHSPLSASPIAGAAISVADTTTRTAGIRIARTYALPQGKAVSSSVVLRNVTKKPLTRTWPEVIPKELAADVSQVTFSQPPTKIINRDPIVVWKVHLAPGKARTISWTTKLPPGQTANKALLAKTVQWHREAIVTSADEVDAALKANSGNGGSLISAGESVGGIPVAAGSGSSGIEGGSIGGGSTYPGGTRSGGASGGPGSIGGGSTYTGGTRSGGASGSSGSTSGGGSSGHAAAAPPNRAPSVTVPASSTSNELTGVSFNVGASDPDGNLSGVHISGLPPGVGSNGAHVSGVISRDASSATSSWKSIGSRTFTVNVTATDRLGKSTTRYFRWTVRDTHLAMPNYRGKFGCAGAPGCAEKSPPNVSAISPHTNGFACTTNGTQPPNTIYSQSIAPGTTIAWGAEIAFVYHQESCSP